MAGADGIQCHELDPLDVPDNLFKRGNKFVKWPKSDSDDSVVATPVTLRIDPKGYIIYWQEPNRDAESLEISSIRDTRIGKYAKIPKDPQIRDVAGNTSIPLETKCLTIVHGMKFHEVQFLNFIAVEENPWEIIKQWSNFLLELATHPLTWHVSVERSIEKMHTKLINETNTMGKIPVKKCIKMLGGNSSRAENALHSVGLISKKKKDEMIEPSEFPLIAFKKVLQLICQRPELDKVFTHLGGKMYLSLDQTKRFINTTQRDPRLNEILHPYLTDDQVRTLIAKYEPNVMLANRSQLSLEGLDAYLQSDENLPVTSVRYSLYQDMNQPLSHYFINSSHNTYLSGNQYRSRSTTEMYRQCLLSGCRCVELDCWDSGGQVEPYITHGFSLCSEVSFKDVIEAIDESSFKTNPYPVILSFENHVDSPANQAKMAEYCRDIFGDKLLIDPLETHPLETGVPLPSPKDLLGKIIVKNKKQKPVPKKPAAEDKELIHAQSFDAAAAQFDKMVPSELEPSSTGTLPRNGTPQRRKASAPAPSTGDINSLTSRTPLLPAKEGKKILNKQNSGDIQEEPESEETENDEQKEKSAVDEEDDDDEEEEEGQLMKDEFDINMKESGTATKESRAYEAMSSLVNYIQPVRFKSFEHSEKKDRSYEISSLTENGALRLITYYPIEIVNYNKRQMSRIYPKGARVDSSNYNPQLFWNAGCQLVALNFQTLGPNMQLNLGLFEFNNNCGYLLKPELMRRKDRQFDPFAHNTMDGVVAASLSVKVISGQFLSTSKISTFVEVDMYGLVADTVKKRFKTCTIQSNGTNPYYNSEAFVFERIVLPPLANLRIGVQDTNGNCIGQRFLPVDGLRPGYRYVTLRNEGNQPLTMPSVFLYIEVKDYIPEKLGKMVDMLVNPIAHIEQKEKEEGVIRDRAKALHILLDEEEKKEYPILDEPDMAGEKSFVIMQGPVPVEDPNKPKTQTRVIVMPDVGTSGGSDDSPTSKNENKGSLEQAYLTPFEPAGLEAMKQCKDFQDLQKKMDKKVTDFLKKQREDYDTVFRAYFEKPKTSLFFSKKDKLKKLRLPFEPNMALPPEAKKEHMLILIKTNLEHEKLTRQGINDDFMREFEDIVRREQEKELKSLEKLCEKEKLDIKTRRKSEREERLRTISKHCSKEELELQKQEIDKNHITDVVREIRMLTDLHDKRHEKIVKEQHEILTQVSDEERSRVDKINQDYKEQYSNIEKIFDIRQADYYRKRGHATINSVSYSNDGVNDEGRPKTYH